jgi:enolase
MTGSRIASVTARRVWDSRGRPTVEAEIATEGGARGRAIAPAGASTGSGEAIDLRDGGVAFGGLDVQQAIRPRSGTRSRRTCGASMWRTRRKSMRDW